MLPCLRKDRERGQRNGNPQQKRLQTIHFTLCPKKRCSRGSGQLQEGPALQGRLAASRPEKEKKKKRKMNTGNENGR